MTPAFTILTVCTGNIHRSALAATLLETWRSWYLPAQTASLIRVHSAGFAAPVGSPMGEHVRLVAAALGGDGTAHRATQLTDEMIASADLVLVASRRQRDEALARVPSALRTTFTMREAGRICEALPPASPADLASLRSVVALMADHRGEHADPGSDDVIDPQGRDLDAFVQMTREEVVPLARLGAALFGMPAADLRAYLAVVDDPAAVLAMLGTDPAATS